MFNKIYRLFKPFGGPKNPEMDFNEATTIDYDIEPGGTFKPLDERKVREKILILINKWKKCSEGLYRGPKKLTISEVFAFALLFNPKTQKLTAYFWPSNTSLHQDWQRKHVYERGEMLALIDSEALESDIKNGNVDTNNDYRRYPLIGYRFNVSDITNNRSIQGDIDLQMKKIMEALNPKYVAIKNGVLVASEKFEVVPVGFHDRGRIFFIDSEAKKKMPPEVFQFRT